MQQSTSQVKAIPIIGLSNASPVFPSTSKLNFHIPFIDVTLYVVAVPTKVAPAYN